jgi:hypothetical protein
MKNWPTSGMAHGRILSTTTFNLLARTPLFFLFDLLSSKGRTGICWTEMAGEKCDHALAFLFDRVFAELLLEK